MPMLYTTHSEAHVTYYTRRKPLQFVILPLIALSSTICQADVVQSTVTLPPLTASYTFSGGTCLSSLSRCLENARVFDFVITSDTEMPAGHGQQDELVAVHADFSGGVYTDNSGSPGTFVGNIMLTGTMDITYFDRNPGIQPLGIFDAQITNFQFNGMLNGNTFEIIQNPNPGEESTGQTTISPVLPFNFSNPMYDVSSYFDINGEYSFNGSPFMAGPPRTATATTPEPAYTALAGSLLIGVLGFARRRRRV